MKNFNHENVEENNNKKLIDSIIANKDKHSCDTFTLNELLCKLELVGDGSISDKEVIDYLTVLTRSGKLRKLNRVYTVMR